MTWQEDNQHLTNDYRLADFRSALDFVNRVGELAETQNHHPDILIHDYCSVRLTLTTHSEATVTEKDRRLAAAIDQLFLAIDLQKKG